MIAMIKLWPDGQYYTNIPLQNISKNVTNICATYAVMYGYRILYMLCRIFANIS
jgi:hypothetical protein